MASLLAFKPPSWPGPRIIDGPRRERVRPIRILDVESPTDLNVGVAYACWFRIRCRSIQERQGRIEQCAPQAWGMQSLL